MAKIITSIELTEEEDRKLRVEAAKQGLSKRGLAAQIIIEWLNVNYSKNLRDIVRDINIEIMDVIEDKEEGEILIDDVLNFIDGCMELVKINIVENSVDTELKKKETIIKNLTDNIETINEFCKLHGITPIPDRPLDDLAFELVNEYRT